jgi:hypothetical protein
MAMSVMPSPHVDWDNFWGEGVSYDSERGREIAGSWRQQAADRLNALAGYDSEGNIAPPTEDFPIDQGVITWWKNRLS